jgi:hypothetical protein
MSFSAPLIAAAFRVHKATGPAYVNAWNKRLYAQRKTPRSYGNRPGTNRQTRPKRTPGNCHDVNADRHAIVRACDQASRRWNY